MSLINFQSTSEIEKNKKLEKQARKEILAKVRKLIYVINNVFLFKYIK